MFHVEHLLSILAVICCAKPVSAAPAEVPAAILLTSRGQLVRITAHTADTPTLKPSISLQTIDSATLSGDVGGTRGRRIFRGRLNARGGGAVATLFWPPADVRFATVSADGQLLAFSGMS